MFKIITAAAMMLATSVAWAQAELTVSDLARQPESKAAFSAMVKKQTLPEWVTKGGTASPAKQVSLNGTTWQVVSACKPHDCAAERIAVLWSPEKKSMAGLFSTVDEAKSSEQLNWLSISDELSIDGKTVLYAALSGSLENHPDAFNDKE